MRVSTKTSAWARRIPGRRTPRKGALKSLLLMLLSWFGGPTPGAAQDPGQFPAIPPMYASNPGGGIAEISAGNNSVLATEPLPNGANRPAVTPDGRCVGNRDGGCVTVFDTGKMRAPSNSLQASAGVHDKLKSVAYVGQTHKRNRNGGKR